MNIDIGQMELGLRFPKPQNNCKNEMQFMQSLQKI